MIVLLASCGKSNLFSNRFTLNVENNTSYYKSMKLVIDGSTGRLDSIVFALQPNAEESFEWKKPKMDGEGTVLCYLNDSSVHGWYYTNKSFLVDETDIILFQDSISIADHKGY
ncbi:MAG: hypothetical protein ISP71_04230 [Flavobacteriales bacterium]|nr:hypothetical protein [Flavobacteriales bacterium]